MFKRDADGKISPILYAILSWLAAISILVAVILGGHKSFEYFLEYRQEQQPDVNVGDAHDYANTSNKRPYACGSIMSETGFFDWLACFGDQVTATDDNPAAKYDLQAQQDMAAWALGMLLVTIWLTIITLMGVFYVWRTFAATKTMTIDAARIGKAQTRAYLGFTKVDTDASRGIQYFHIKNSGNSPAHDVQIGRYVFFDGKVDWSIVEEERINDPKGVFNPQGGSVLMTNVIRAQDGRAVVAFKVTYRDTFKNRHELTTTFESLNINGNLKFITSKDGTQAT